MDFGIFFYIILFIICVLLIIILTMNLWLPIAIKIVGRKVTGGFRVSVGRSRCSIFRGLVHLENVILKNPQPQFKRDEFVEVNKVVLHIKIPSLFSQVILVKKLHLELSKLFIVRISATESNVTTLVKNILQFIRPITDKGEPKGKENSKEEDVSTEVCETDSSGQDSKSQAGEKIDESVEPDLSETIQDSDKTIAETEGIVKDQTEDATKEKGTERAAEEPKPDQDKNQKSGKGLKIDEFSLSIETIAMAVDDGGAETVHNIKYHKEFKDIVDLSPVIQTVGIDLGKAGVSLVFSHTIDSIKSNITSTFNRFWKKKE